MSTTLRDREGQARMRFGPGESLGAALVAALLFGLSLFMPLLALVSTLAPLPLIVQRIRGGAFSAGTAALLAAALIAAVSPGQSLFFLVFLVAPGLLIGEAIARGRGIVRGCNWAFALLALEIGAALFFASPRLAAVAVAPFEQTRSAEFLQVLRTSGWSQDRIDAWDDQSRTLGEVMAVVYPAVFVILGAMIVLANAALLRAYLAKRDPGWLEMGEFESIRWPLGLVVAFVLSGASVLLPPLRHAGYNVLLVVAFFFALQGLAVAAFFAQRLAGPPLLRAGLVILVLLNPWAPQILALLGLVDVWFDFRKYAEPPETRPGQA